jgi:hypothetical protein
MKNCGTSMNSITADCKIEISVKGRWMSVPAFSLAGNTIIVTGSWLKLAVVHDEQWLENALEDPELCVRLLKEQVSHGLRADIFTFAQPPPDTAPKYSYYMNRDSLAAIRLTRFKDWWENLPQESRKNVRRSQKRGVVVSVKEFDDDVISGIVEINNESPFRQGRRFTHYGKSCDQVKKDHSAFLDRCDFICAHVGDELIGFLKLVYRGQVASVLQLLSKASHHDKKPANALIAKAVELCEAKRVSCLTYGMFNYGNKRDSSIREFKIRNGFEEILVPRFYVPLTLKGKIALKLNLHRGLLEILPEDVIRLAVGLRTKVLHVRQSISRCSSMLERPNSDRQTGCSNPPAGSNF